MLKKLAVIAAVALAPLAAGASQLPDYPFIHATGNASIDVVPDIGTIDFDIASADADPAAARAAVEARVSEVRALLEAQGLPVEDVEVRDVRQEVRKDTPPGAPLYDVKCSVHLNVRNLSKWPAIAGALLGMANLDGFYTAFDTSEREKTEMELMAQSIRDARRRAEAMAAGFGRKLGSVTAVTAGALKNLGNAMGLVPADFSYRSNSTRAQRVDRREIVNINMLKLAQPVDVIFRIK